MGKDFEDLIEDIEREAAEAGPAATVELEATRLKYRMLNALVERRRELHLTQKQVAERAGVGQAEISKIERGRKSPTIDTYSRLASVLRLDLPQPRRRGRRERRERQPA